MAQSRSQVVESCFIKAHQGLRSASAFVQEKQSGNGLRIVSPREHQLVIELDPVADLHRTGKLAGWGFTILGNRNHLDRSFRQRVEIGQHKLAGGAVRLKEDEQRFSSCLQAGNCRHVFQLPHENKDRRGRDDSTRAQD